MNWTSEWGDMGVIFGYDFAAVLAEGIEWGLDELDYLQEYGRFCDGCGNWRVTSLVNCDESIPTDYGEELRLMPYELCAECQREMFES